MVSMMIRNYRGWKEGAAGGCGRYLSWGGVWVWVVGVVVGMVGGVEVWGWDEAQFEADVKALTAWPHRLAGTAEGQAAGAYIQRRLEEMGVQTLVLDMPVRQMRTVRCELEVEGRVVKLYPMRSNVLVPPATGPEGISGPMIYAGRGELAEYGGRNPDGAIVVLEYECDDNWERAFALGAKAVIFLGRADAAPVQPRHVMVPVNLLRFYADERAQEAVDLRRDRAWVRLVSHIRWEESWGRNVLAYLPGTEAVVDPANLGKAEVVVLGAAYDSFGVVPELSPGARGAANVAALLEAVAYFKERRPRRDLVVMFLDNDAQYHQGTRYIYDTLGMSEGEPERLVRQAEQEKQLLEAVAGVLSRTSLSQLSAQEPEQSPWYVRLGYLVGAIAGVGLLVMAVAWAGRRHWLLGVAAAVAAGGVVVGVGWAVVSLTRQEQAVEPEVMVRLREALEKEAEFIRADINQKLVELRLERERVKGTEAEEALRQRMREIQEEVLAWDQSRRWLDRRRYEAIDPELGRQLVAAALGRIQRRLNELELQLRIGRQRQQLWEVLGRRWVSLHVTYNFSDMGPGWGLVVGDWTERSYWGLNAQGDHAGHYGRVLAAFRDAASKAVFGEGVPGPVLVTLSDTRTGSQHVPGRYVSSGICAGTFGIYNVAFMTSFDGRVRDGHPSDRLEYLNWGWIRRQAMGGTLLVEQVASSPLLSLYRVFNSLAESKRPTWTGGRATGDYVGLQVTGSLSEDRPATGALITVIPNAPDSIRSGDWSFMRNPGLVPGFEPLVVETVDGNGRFPIIGVRKDLFTNLAGLGLMFDETGRVNAITTMETLRTTNLSAALRYNLFPARGGVLVDRLLEQPGPWTLGVYSAATNAPFARNKTFFAQVGNVVCFYVSALIPPPGVKVFQPRGPVFLNVKEADERQPFGLGKSVAELQTPVAIDEYTAFDLWRLNEMRLEALRRRSVTAADLEALHSRAGQALEKAQGARTVAERQAFLKQSARLSTAVYWPLRNTMDDLVKAIVFLLLLAIPFAFAMERLLFAATTIYQRLMGFAGIFMVTFVLLFFMHPGFAIASTPVIIFLAFAILLLSCLVIYIIVRKFRTELAAMQGQGVSLHHLEISRLGTLVAAVNMGMSTMRRRPTRTTLTAVTVVMLTFTILCFASLSSRMGVRVIGQGPVNEEVAPAIEVRHLNYQALSPEYLTLLEGMGGSEGLVAGQWWLVRAAADEDPFSVARPDTGTALWLDGMLGLTPEELRRWPELAAALGGGDVEEKIKALGSDGVFLPAIVQEKLKLRVGQTVLFHGRPARFAGVLDGTALQRLTQLDGRSVLPVDLLEASQALSEGNLGSEVEENVERDFVYLSPDQIAVASAELVRRLGGTLRVVNIYPDESVRVVDRAREIVQMVGVPVWVKGPAGVDRMVFTRLTQVSGGLVLLVPIVLGGLIIFGTLLGSITDREREIYTFSALGLAPKHVGFLFFAEASVYAVVGGMMGQLLAQGVAMVATRLAEWGLIRPPSINYSSTNSLFAIGLVMATVLISAIYPAIRASRSANPGLSRTWRMPKPEGDELKMVFPFTVSAYDITGVVSFLAEHFRAHNDAGLGVFAAQNVGIGREEGSGNLRLTAHLALAPFDLGVTQDFVLTARPSEIEGVDEIAVHVRRASGANSDWYRANRVFFQDLRRQFLLWRTLSAEMVEQYRMQTLEVLGEDGKRAVRREAVEEDQRIEPVG